MVPFNSSLASLLMKAHLVADAPVRTSYGVDSQSQLFHIAFLRRFADLPGSLLRDFEHLVV
jgi:hypothetical protein